VSLSTAVPEPSSLALPTTGLVSRVICIGRNQR
jgi:hypothetical protein